MKLLCLLALVVALTAGNDPVYTDGYDLTIDVLTELTAALEDEVKSLAGIASDLQTVCSATDANINYIQDFFLPRIDKQNEQQYALIADYQAQVKGLQHRVDEAKSTEKEVLVLAEATEVALGEQINDYLNGSEIYDVNKEQQLSIIWLTEYLPFFKEAYLSSLNDTIDGLEAAEGEAEDKIDELADFVNNRKCEYGSGSFNPYGISYVPFKTTFDVVPDVALTLTGFRAHADVHTYNREYDILYQDKYVSDVDTQGFYIDADDASEGMIEVKEIYCSWMACQYLNGVEVDLHD